MANIDIENYVLQDGRESPPFNSRSFRDDRRPRSRKRKVRMSSTPRTFSQKLGLAALGDDGKVAPLYTERPTDSSEKPKPTIRIRALQHMTVIHLRRVIAGQVNEIVQTETATPELMERARKTMKQYVQALRDLKYMLEDPSQNKRVSKYMKDLLYINDRFDGAIMADAGLLGPASRNYELRVSDYTGHGGYYDVRGTAAEETQAFFSRLWMALFGGAVLIAPMLIMRLHPTLVTELVTTSAFVLAFGIILAWFMTDANSKDILGATAAYAAVLVVFIGTSS